MTASIPSSLVYNGGLAPGFADPVFDAQEVFRAAMWATAYPGRIVPLNRAVPASAPFDSATTALALTLLDFETPLWLDKVAQQGEVHAWLSFHCGMPVVATPNAARFAIAVHPAELPRLADFCLSDAEFPDRSTTLIIQVPCFENGPRKIWRGPGIKEIATVRIAGLSDVFWSDWSLNREVYPAGIDIFFTCGNALISMPRTVKVEA